MVDAGFYCIGFDNHVSCFIAGKQLFSWKPCDNLVVQARRMASYV